MWPEAEYSHDLLHESQSAREDGGEGGEPEREREREREGVGPHPVGFRVSGFGVRFSGLGFSVSGTDLDVDLEAARAEEGIIDQVLAVRHPDDQHIVQPVHPVCPKAEY